MLSVLKLDGFHSWLKKEISIGSTSKLLFGRKCHSNQETALSLRDISIHHTAWTFASRFRRRAKYHGPEDMRSWLPVVSNCRITWIKRKLIRTYTTSAHLVFLFALKVFNGSGFLPPALKLLAPPFLKNLPFFCRSELFLNGTKPISTAERPFLPSLGKR